MSDIALFDRAQILSSEFKPKRATIPCYLYSHFSLKQIQDQISLNHSLYRQETFTNVDHLLTTYLQHQAEVMSKCSTFASVFRHGGKLDTKGQTSAKLFWETFVGLGRSLLLGIYFST